MTERRMEAWVDHLMREIRLREKVHDLQHESGDHCEGWGSFAHDRNVSKLRELRVIVAAIQPLTWRVVATDD